MAKVLVRRLTNNIPFQARCLYYHKSSTQYYLSHNVQKLTSVKPMKSCVSRTDINRLKNTQLKEENDLFKVLEMVNTVEDRPVSEQPEYVSRICCVLQEVVNQSCNNKNELEISQLFCFGITSLEIMEIKTKLNELCKIVHTSPLFELLLILIYKHFNSMDLWCKVKTFKSLRYLKVNKYEPDFLKMYIHLRKQVENADIKILSLLSKISIHQDPVLKHYVAERLRKCLIDSDITKGNLQDFCELVYFCGSYLTLDFKEKILTKLNKSISVKDLTENNMTLQYLLGYLVLNCTHILYPTYICLGVMQERSLPKVIPESLRLVVLELLDKIMQISKESCVLDLHTMLLVKRSFTIKFRNEDWETMIQNEILQKISDAVKSNVKRMDNFARLNVLNDSFFSRKQVNKLTKIWFENLVKKHLNDIAKSKNFQIGQFLSKWEYVDTLLMENISKKAGDQILLLNTFPWYVIKSPNEKHILSEYLNNIPQMPLNRIVHVYEAIYSKTNLSHIACFRDEVSRNLENIHHGFLNNRLMMKLFKVFVKKDESRKFLSDSLTSVLLTKSVLMKHEFTTNILICILKKYQIVGFFHEEMYDYVASYLTDWKEKDKLKAARCCNLFLKCCASMGYVPKTMKNLLEIGIASKQMKLMVQILLSAAELQHYDIKQTLDIFSFKNFETLIGMTQNNCSAASLVKLNRHICLECPEVDLPWLFGGYDEKTLQTIPYRMEVAQILENIFGPNKFRFASCSPYQHTIDLEVHVNEKGEFIQPLDPADEDIHSVQKIAIVLLTSHNYVYHSKTKLRNSCDVFVRHLEMLGYDVIPISIYDWYNMDYIQQIDYIIDKVNKVKRFPLKSIQC